MKIKHRQRFSRRLFHSFFGKNRVAPVTLFQTFDTLSIFATLVLFSGSLEKITYNFGWHNINIEGIKHGTKSQIGRINNTIFSVINPMTLFFLSVSRQVKNLCVSFHAFIHSPTDNDVGRKA
jgi:hypothetical protein